MWPISDLGGRRRGLGPRFGGFLGTLGGILVIWEDLGKRLEFHCILAYPGAPPELREPGQLRVKVLIPGSS